LRRYGSLGGGLLTVLSAIAALAQLAGLPALALVGVGAGLAVVAYFLVREDRRARVERLESQLRWPVQQVRELDAGKFGLPRGPAGAGHAGGRATAGRRPRRSADVELDAAIRSAAAADDAPRLVIAHGPDRTAAVRALFEAALRNLPDASLLAPTGSAAVEELARPGVLPDRLAEPVILWLGEIAPYAAAGSCAGALERLGRGGPRLVVLATATARRRRRGGAAADRTGPLEDLLREAEVIWLPRDPGALKRVSGTFVQAVLRTRSSGDFR
jgi:hypothetical protein